MGGEYVDEALLIRDLLVRRRWGELLEAVEETFDGGGVGLEMLLPIRLELPTKGLPPTNIAPLTPA